MKTLGKLLLVVLCVVIGIFLGEQGLFDNIFRNSVSVPSNPTSETTITVSNVKTELKEAKDLVSTKVFYKDADTYENHKTAFDVKMPFTSTNAVFTYTGTVLIGVNLDNVYTNIDNDNKTITITLPSVEILANDIDFDSFEYYKDDQSIFNIPSMEQYTQLLAELKEKKRDEILSNTEIMEQAKVNSQNAIKSVIMSADLTKDYEVKIADW